MAGNVIAVAVGLWLGFWCGLVTGRGDGEEHIRMQAVKEHHAHWDSSTREFMWNTP